MILILETRALPTVGLLEKGTTIELSDALEEELVRQGVAEYVVHSLGGGTMNSDAFDNEEE